MKNNMMKKLLTLVLAGAMTLSLAACGAKDTPSADQPDNSTEEAKTYKVAVIKQLDHASLDEIANAVTAELDKIAADNGVTIEYEVTSGQGDQTILKQLSDQAIADGVNAIVDELRGEKIDIVKYSEDPAEFIAAALAPADVVSVQLADEGKACRVTVPADQLSLAIGKEGQNARLAARLTGYKIDIKAANAE